MKPQFLPLLACDAEEKVRVPVARICLDRRESVNDVTYVDPLKQTPKMG
ncbi:hypothetical protein FOXB_00139 [Fusarium oxysporum f. sp. conglutinans Fo5176]|uniref:Uncharacterized protein n=1 Tax=Fusarium oxysporum (strain Fo5176) TaxID=660025 RepID=F9F165_FUSOF|nr:hypothetical protein FOXB_00139 [Fusarium oxysporum f. sp. conglutinans Fo5176]